MIKRVHFLDKHYMTVKVVEVIANSDYMAYYLADEIYEQRGWRFKYVDMIIDP